MSVKRPNGWSVHGSGLGAPPKNAQQTVRVVETGPMADPRVRALSQIAPMVGAGFAGSFVGRRYGVKGLIALLVASYGANLVWGDMASTDETRIVFGTNLRKWSSAESHLAAWSMPLAPFITGAFMIPIPTVLGVGVLSAASAVLLPSGVRKVVDYGAGALSIFLVAKALFKNYGYTPSLEAGAGPSRIKNMQVTP